MNMIEKVAQAIADNIAATLPAGVEVDTRYAAVAAIEALREPTEAMKEAAYGSDVWSSHDSGVHEIIEATYPAMIDAALKE